MKVWVVMEHIPYEGSSLHYIASTEEKAEAFLDAQRSTDGGFMGGVDEWEVDAPWAVVPKDQSLWVAKTSNLYDGITVTKVSASIRLTTMLTPEPYDHGTSGGRGMIWHVIAPDLGTAREIAAADKNEQ